MLPLPSQYYYQGNTITNIINTITNGDKTLKNWWRSLRWLNHSLHCTSETKAMKAMVNICSAGWQAFKEEIVILQQNLPKLTIKNLCSSKLLDNVRFYPDICSFRRFLVTWWWPGLHKFLYPTILLYENLKLSKKIL